MGRKPKVPATSPEPTEDLAPPQQVEEMPDEVLQQQPLSSVQASLMDFLAESLGCDDLNWFMPPPLIGAGKGDFFMSDALLEAPGNSASLFDMEPNFGLSPVESNEPTMARDESTAVQQVTEEEEEKPPSSSSESEEEEPMETEQPQAEEPEEEEDNFQPRIVQVTNYQAQEQQTPQIKEEPLSAMDNKEDIVEPELLESDTITLERCKPSGFVRQPRRNWPWLQETDNEPQPEGLEEQEQQQELRLMSVYEEQQLHQQLQKVFALEQEQHIDIPAYVRRFYRKLCVRKWKRDHNRAIFNLDEHIDPTARARMQQEKKQAQILDRYQLLELGNPDIRSSFYARIMGSTEHELFESPYTQRVLHPFIYRSQTIVSPWLRLMCELKHRVNKIHPSRSTIDFCYVRPQHIPAVNALLQSVFWPGIDGELAVRYGKVVSISNLYLLFHTVSDCLSYPDYSVVALYKKLVVGCGFLVPDVGYNEAYISFMAVRHNWQRSGIATFMLYHLIQTCMSKDITLHVSANNSAVMLYQKFGFKIEEVIVDFYDKYLPLDSKQSRNAFFLRLMR